MSERQMQEIKEQIGRGVLEQAQVDRSTGRISDVAMLGRVSENNRVYTDAAMKDAARLYEGAPLYIDHPKEGELRDRGGIRSVRDLAGRVLTPRKVGDQVRGDLELLDAEPARSLILSLAETMPGQAGLSHRARGEVEVGEDGRQVVRSLEQVAGVELVTEPATVSGLLEGIEREDAREAVRAELREAGVLEHLSEPTVQYLASLDEEQREAELAHYTGSSPSRPWSRGRGRGSSAISLEREPEAMVEDGPERSNGRRNHTKLRFSAGELEEAHRQVFGR